MPRNLVKSFSLPLSLSHTLTKRQSVLSLARMSAKEDLKVPKNKPNEESNSKAEAEKRAALARMAQILQEYQEFVQNQLKDLQQTK